MPRARSRRRRAARPYDAQLRAHLPDRLPEGVHVERDGPLLHFVGFGHGGFVGYRDLGGLDGTELDDLIARQVRVFADRGEAFEWKLHGHDRPADLAEQLVAMGFVPEDRETVVIAPVSAVAGEALVPDGVTLRKVRERADLDRIGTTEEAIWHDDRAGWLADGLEAEHAVDPDAMAIVVAEAGEQVVCAAWVRFVPGTDFATLWGGGTLSEWRRRESTARSSPTVRTLPRSAGSAICRWIASADSRPILERLGFVAVTTTMPFVWTPPPAP